MGQKMPLRMTDTHTLNAGLWFRRGRLVMIFSLLAAIMPLLRRKSTYPGCSVFPGHLNPSVARAGCHIRSRPPRRKGRAGRGGRLIPAAAI